MIMIMLLVIISVLYSIGRSNSDCSSHRSNNSKGTRARISDFKHNITNHDRLNGRGKSDSNRRL